MGFDAGAITGYLILNTDQYQAALDEAAAEAAAFPKEIVVDVDANAQQFDQTAAEVEADKAILSTPVVVPVTVDDATFTTDVTEIEAVKETVSATPIRVAIDSTVATDLQEVYKQLATTTSSPEQQVISRLLGQGTSQADTVLAIQSMFGGNKSAISSAVTQMVAQANQEIERQLAYMPASYGAEMSEELAKAILPTQTQFREALEAGAYSMLGAGGGGASTFDFVMQAIARNLSGEQVAIPARSGAAGYSFSAPELQNLGRSTIENILGYGEPGTYSLAAGEKTSTGTFAATVRDLFGNQAAIGPGGTGGALAELFHGFGSLGAEADEGAEASSGGFFSSLLGRIFSKSPFTSDLGDLGVNGFSDAMGFNVANAGALASLSGKAFTAPEGAADEGGLWGALGELGGMQQAGLAAAPLIGPIGGALLTALGGAAAGTQIGGAGTLGFDYLAYKAYENMSAVNTDKGELASGQMTKAQYAAAMKGMPTGAIQGAAAMSSMGNAFSKVTSGAMNGVYSILTKLFDAVAKAAPVFGPFFKDAVKAMDPFFSALDKGLDSKGFENFMGSIEKLEGPIMREFGQVILNVGRAWGDFLRDFGGVAGSAVGPWFVRITGNMADFFQKLSVGSPQIREMVNVFNDLGAIFDLVWTAASKLITGLAPIGAWFLNFITPMVRFATEIIRLIPPQVITALGILLLLISPIGSALEVVIGIAALFHVNWKALWDDIVSVTGAAWQLLDNDVIDPLINFFTQSVPHAWSIVSGAFETGWHDVTNIAKEIWNDIETYFGDPVHTFFAVTVPKDWNDVTGAFETGWHDITKFAQDIWSDIETYFGDPVHKFFTVTIPQDWNSFTSFIEALPSKILTWLGNGAELLIGWGKDLIKGLVTGIEDSGSFLVNAFKSLISKIPGGSLIEKGLGAVGGVLKHLATGGTLAAGQFAVVGENGPELFMPNVGGSVIPNSRLSYSGGQGITNYITVDARGATSPQATSIAARQGISTALPALSAALARGAT